MNVTTLNEMPHAKSGTWDFKYFDDKPKIITSDTIDSFKQMFIKNHKNELYYFLWNDHDTWYVAHAVETEKFAIVGYLKVVDYQKLPNAWQIDGVDIHKDYRNLGLATLMYASIQSKTNKKLVSDNSQYTDSRKIWLSLSRSIGVKIYDETTGEKTGYVKINGIDDPEIWGPQHSRKLLLIENRTLFED